MGIDQSLPFLELWASGAQFVQSLNLLKLWAGLSLQVEGLRPLQLEGKGQGREQSNLDSKSQVPPDPQNLSVPPFAPPTSQKKLVPVPLPIPPPLCRVSLGRKLLHILH